MFGASIAAPALHASTTASLNDAQLTQSFRLSGGSRTDKPARVTQKFLDDDSVISLVPLIYAAESNLGGAGDELIQLPVLVPTTAMLACIQKGMSASKAGIQTGLRFTWSQTMTRLDSVMRGQESDRLDNLGLDGAMIAGICQVMGKCHDGMPFAANGAIAGTTTASGAVVIPGDTVGVQRGECNDIVNGNFQIAPANA
eukprot:1384107-Amphidinium_carterae.1